MWPTDYFSIKEIARKFEFLTPGRFSQQEFQMIHVGRSCQLLPLNSINIYI